MEVEQYVNKDKHQRAQPRKREMSGPPDINDLLNNMSSKKSNNLDLDLNSNLSVIVMLKQLNIWIFKQTEIKEV